jgi:hypothetical protein
MSTTYGAAHKQLVGTRVCPREWLEWCTHVKPSPLTCEALFTCVWSPRHSRTKPSLLACEALATRVRNPRHSRVQVTLSFALVCAHVYDVYRYIHVGDISACTHRK